MYKLNIHVLQKGAINMVEIETLIFVKYNGDKHIKNTAPVSFAKSIILKGKSKMTDETLCTRT